VTHEKRGVTIHTAEYDVRDWDEKILYNALFSGRIASWHFTITKEGWLFQHYPVDTTCWHCGYPGNLWAVGIECEGIAPDKISGPQYDLLVRLLKWLKENLGWRNGYHRGLVRSPSVEDAQVYEHRDWMATDCAVFTRGMIDPDFLIIGLKEEEVPEIEDEFVLFRAREIGFMQVADAAHNQTLMQQFNTISNIRHSWGESTLNEMECWKRLSRAYDAEVNAIRRAQEQCRWLGRPG